jgi:hypothetical protein
MNHKTIALFLLGLATVCSAQQLPVGWTKPPANLTGQQFREKDPNHFLVVKGEFNGDGVQDKAMLLVNQHTQKMGFFVCLTTATGCDWHRLEVMDIAFLDVMGIARVKPGGTKPRAGKATGSAGRMNPKSSRPSAMPWSFSRTKVQVRSTSTIQ